MGQIFKPRWRDDPMRWEVTSGTIFNILENNERDETAFEEGLYPSEIVNELVRLSRKYGEVESHDVAYDAVLLLTSTPSVMSLISALAGSKKAGASKSLIERGPVMYTNTGQVKLTEYGHEELKRIYGEFSKRVGIDIDRKSVDMNEPLLKWQPPSGWGITREENDKLPPKRETRSRLTYRQWLTMIYKESRVYVAAQEDLMAERPLKPGTPEAEKKERSIKSRHAQIKHVRLFAKLVLSGGPESVWMGKPIIPKDVHNDVESFYAAGKPGFNAQIVEASSLAWELWETDIVSLSEYADIREWVELKTVEERTFTEKAKALPEGIPTDDSDRPLVYRKASNRSEDASTKAIEQYDPFGVNQPMDFAASRMAQQIIDPGKFAQVNADGSLTHVRCDYSYSADNRDPGYVSYSRKTGSRCPNIAVTGTTRCEMHGGLLASPAETRAMIVASQMQAFALSGQAMATIADIMVHGQNETSRLRAAETILNRSGVIEGAEVDVRDARKEAASDGTSARDVVMDRLRKLANYEAAESAREEEAKKELDNDVVEGTVVEEGDEQTA
ncbi:hypothetical protein SEA_FORZA_175 [Gordonia phage Forza]|uniref:Uncharacterized protein n=1 Tax=Gordonia phage Forza TaxID=2571247 RepID=A0A650EYA2_9CAUD|nr:hypothetical protein PP303_gp153 [Gordonia phage Forza]QGT55136.1 hypothetical protein SEA_FORZA_175 [Gordonia phage Forza]UXE04284.1 hypothetical protein SEA_BLUENGOLD_171 [Gordonia phage BlueNGold]WBF03925.1 hypothetical protein SEA_MAREELIH_172 [Gordonia phage Mareelih]